MEEPVQNAVEHRRLVFAAQLLGGNRVLDLVEQDEVAAVLAEALVKVPAERVGVAQMGIFIGVERHLDHMVVGDADVSEVLSKQVEYEIGFPAAAYPGDHLDGAVAHSDDEVIQILVALDPHNAPPNLAT